MSLEYKGSSRELQEMSPLRIRQGIEFIVKSREGDAKSLSKVLKDFTIIVLPNYEGDPRYEFLYAEIKPNGDGTFKIKSYQTLEGVYINGKNIGRGIELGDGRKVSPEGLARRDGSRRYQEVIHTIAEKDESKSGFVNMAVSYYEARDARIANAGEMTLKEGDIISIAGESFLFSEK